MPPNRTASRARKKFSSPCGLTDLFLLGGTEDPDETLPDDTIVTLLLLLVLELPSLFEF